jgi:hypothetical protein
MAVGLVLYVHLECSKIFKNLQALWVMLECIQVALDSFAVVAVTVCCKAYAKSQTLSAAAIDHYICE